MRAKTSYRFSLIAFLLSAFVASSPALSQQTVHPLDQLVRAAVNGDLILVNSTSANVEDLNALIDLTTRMPVDPAEENGEPTIDAVGASIICGCPLITAALIEAGATVSAAHLNMALQYNDVEIGRQLIRNYQYERSDDRFIATLAQRLPNQSVAALRRFFKAMINRGGERAEDDSEFAFSTMFERTFAINSADPAFVLLDEAVNAGFDINAPGEYEDQSLSARAISAVRGDVLFSRELAKRNSSLPAGWTAETDQATQLIGAIENGNEVGIELLLAAGLSPNTAAYDGRIALATAIEVGDVTIAELLLQRGADPNLHGPDQQSPLVSAAQQNWSGFGQRLIELGADYTAIDGTGMFPLRAAVQNGSSAFVDLLLASGVAPNSTDAAGRTALHGIAIVPADGWVRERSRELSLQHFDIVQQLIDSASWHNSTSLSHSLYTSNLSQNYTNYDLLSLFSASGLEASEGDLLSAIRWGNQRLLRTLLVTRKAPPSPNLLRTAALELEREPDLLAALLESGGLLPSNNADLSSMLVAASEIEDTTPLQLLLYRDLPLLVDPTGRAIEAAIRYGRPKSVRILVEGGANPNSRDEEGRTPLHRIVQEAIESAPSTPFSEGQVQAIAVLIEQGYDLSASNLAGETPLSLAQPNELASQALSSAVALSYAQQTGIFSSVRLARYEDLARYAADEEAINSVDELGRTALTLSLQLNDWTAARILLRAGARITINHAEPWMISDLAYAENEEIASAFILRMLDRPLIAIPTDLGVYNLTSIREDYEQANNIDLSAFVWSVGCTFRIAIDNCSGLSVSGNDRVFHNQVESWQRSERSLTEFGLSLRSVRSFVFRFALDIFDSPTNRGRTNVNGGEVTFTIAGAGTLPSCEANFERPTCIPGIRISNPNTLAEFQLRTESGYETPPAATLRLRQENAAPIEIPPGGSTVADRSAGEIFVSMDPVSSRVFSFRIQVEHLRGPEITPLPREWSISTRMQLYSRLAEFDQLIETTREGPEDEALFQTITAARATLSAEAFLADYPNVILTLLRQQAQNVATIDAQTIQILNAARAQSTYTPGQINALIARIDNALALSTSQDRSTLLAVRASLIDMRITAVAVGSTFNEIRNTYFSEADKKLELFQALVLEYQQFFPSASLDELLSAELQEAVCNRTQEWRFASSCQR